MYNRFSVTALHGYCASAFRSLATFRHAPSYRAPPLLEMKVIVTLRKNSDTQYSTDLGEQVDAHRSTAHNYRHSLTHTTQN